jgi:ABC-type Mn2+/Zn2+ transport system ATPase subunit
MELARAIASRPKLLLADEPLAGLGAQEIERLLGTLGALAGAGLIEVITSAIPFLQLSDASEQWLIGGLILLSALGYSTLKRRSATV